ncbi:MAG: hypothetical protein ACE5HX_18645, partial [bacterium]
EVVNDIKPYTLQMELHNGFIQVTISSQKKLNAIIDYLRNHKIDIKSIVPHKQSLEESFIEILKKDVKH